MRVPLVSNTYAVAAPPALVWRVLTDTARYAEWNPRLLRVDGAFAPGAVVTLHYAKDSPVLPARFVVDVDVCAPLEELRWSGPRNAARALFRASHFFRLAAEGAGTSVTHGEEFAGLTAGRVWPWLRRVVEENHADVNRALRARCEALARPS